MEPQQVFSEYEPHSSGLERAQFCQICGAKLSFITAGERPRLRCAECGFAFFHNAIPGAVVLVVEGERFLLCRRSSASHQGPGKWCLPGGVVEWDEDFLSAGVREVQEETGVAVEIESILTLTSNFFHQDSHTLAVVLLAKVVAGEPQGDGIETDAAQWFSASEPLPHMAFEGDHHIIERYFDAPFAGASVDPRYAK